MNRRITLAAVIAVYLIIGAVAFFQFRKMDVSFPTFGETADISLTSPGYDAYLPSQEAETLSEETVQESPEAAQTQEAMETQEAAAEYSFTAVHGQGRLFVRAEPSMSAEILGFLSPGDSGDVLELGTDWALIASGDLTGYVYTEYLELLPR